MLRSIFFGLILAAILILTSCKKEDNTTAGGPKLIFKFQLDSTQARLDNFGQNSAMAAGHAGQNPAFNLISAHYIELAPTSTTLLGQGAVLYRTPTTTAGGAEAIDFTKEASGNSGDIFYSMPLKNVPPNTYEWLRVSLAYQNYTVQYRIDTDYNYMGFPVSIHQDFPCTVASFIGYNTYLSTYTIKTQQQTVNANKAQGYWGAETNINLPQYNYNQTLVLSGQAPGTTVVNPLHLTSPIPLNSCVVTGPFSGANTLTITGNETHDIVVTVSLSTNKSFEWVDLNGNGKWDASKGETVTDMGIRGMVPYVSH